MFWTRLSWFGRDECGAVTVDWVVLTAALVALGAVIGMTVTDGANTMATGVGAEMGEAVVPDVVF